MKYFISDNPRQNRIKSYQNLTSMQSYPIITEFLENTEQNICLDLETTGLDAWCNKSLIYIIGNKETQFLIESYNINKDFLTEVINLLRPFRIIGHNIKFDIKFVFVDTNIWLKKVYDTMIAEQRLYQKLGLRMGLDYLNARYRDVEISDMDKSIRMEFVGADPQYFKIEERHLEYARKDILYLEEIKEKQIKRMLKNSLQNLIYKIEFPLIYVLAKAEVTGFEFDLVKWNKLTQDNIDNKLLIEQKLDIMFRELRDATDLSQEERLRCTGGKYDHKRVSSPLLNTFNVDGSPKGLDLFGNTSTIKAVTNKKAKINFYPKDINYGSDAQVVELFAHLKELLETSINTYDIPTFNKKGKIDKESYSYKTGEDVLTKYFTAFPKSRMLPFITDLLKQRKLNTKINNFGVKYESKINKVTKRLHTVYRQARADTGRLQSGGGRQEPDKPNFQNIPADKEMRSCFISKEGYKIITADYKGAELIVMCSLSQDMKLLEMSKRDMHSEISTTCWKAVFAHRLKQFLEARAYRNSVVRSQGVFSTQEIDAKIKKYEDLVANFIVDKTPENKHFRTEFKPITFGVIYGLRYKNLAEVLNISDEEAKIIIHTIERLFPTVINFVKSLAKFAELNGYLVLNNRSKDRAYFPNIIKYLKGEMSMEFHFAEIMKDVNEARNIAIQGTQATAIKEATVQLQNYIDKRNIDAVLLNFVHDEIVLEISEKDLNKEYTINNITYPDFGKAMEFILTDTFNKYLHNVKIGLDYTVANHWVK